MKPIFSSGMAPTSQILNNQHISRLNALYGFQPVSNPTNNVERQLGARFVQVDLNDTRYSTPGVQLGQFFKNTAMSTNLDKYLDSWLDDTTLSYSDIRERQQRLNELRFCYCNSPFVARTVQLCADEATQLNHQDRLISVDSTSIQFNERVYELFQQWGITQTRLNAVAFDLELYGESFWANKITEKGVEKIIPLKPSQIVERLEFAPVQVAEYLAQRNCSSMSVSRSEKVQGIMKNLEKSSQGVVDMLEKKLLGYELYDNLYLPPWAVTHFRFNADHSEFYPYGRPPLLAALAPFRLTTATRALQGVARALSFPLTLHKVKSLPGMNQSMMFSHVRNVRQQYEQTMANPNNLTGTEVYTANTSMWFPEDLMDVDVKESKVDINFVDDIAMYNDETAVATGVPKGYLVQEWGGWGNSAVSLAEQLKPFACHVYSIQTCILQELSNLIRLHFAVTGEFDANTKFTLAMRFPAEETSEDVRQNQTSSLELSTAVMDLINKMIGAQDGEPLPPEVGLDIASKYSFVDPTYLQQWLYKAKAAKTSRDALAAANGGGSDQEGSDNSGGVDMGGGDSGFSVGGGFGAFGGGSDTDNAAGGTEDTGSSETAGTEAAPDTGAAAPAESAGTEPTTQQESLGRAAQKRIQEVQMKRLQELKTRYFESAAEIYQTVLVRENVTEFMRRGQHVLVSRPLSEDSPMLGKAVAGLGVTAERMQESDDAEAKNKYNQSAELHNAIVEMMSGIRESSSSHFSAHMADPSDPLNVETADVSANAESEAY